ncbi:unnamed protein product, partial [Heterosigma akashiwo]
GLWDVWAVYTRLLATVHSMQEYRKEEQQSLKSTIVEPLHRLMMAFTPTSRIELLASTPLSGM